MERTVRPARSGIRIQIIYDWLAPVAKRMGDGTPPGKDDWPLEMFHADVPTSIIDHWQTRPLASGKVALNGVVAAPDTSPQSPPAASSHPAPQPQ